MKKSNSISQSKIINLCECGCGQQTKFYKGCYNRFIYSHNLPKMSSHPGSKNGSWKGGKIIEDDYYLIKKREYYKTDRRGYVREHVYIFETFYKCCMLEYGVVHHKDGNKLNNLIENLEGMTRRQHKNHHHPPLNKSDWFCLFCHKDNMIWFLYNKGHICTNCYRRLIK